VDKMGFFKPTIYGYTIYTKSNCPYCTKVKDLLQNVEPQPIIINCDDYLSSNDTKEEFLDFIKSINGGVAHRTFPMVFYKGKFIGGFTDTEKCYQQENLCFNF
jgi:glutaredoxin